MTEKELYRKIDEFAEKIKESIDYKSYDVRLLEGERKRGLEYYAATLNCSAYRVEKFILDDMLNRTLDFNIKNVAIRAFLIDLILNENKENGLTNGSKGS